MPTTYQIHWGEADDLTATDATGAAEKTGGAGGAYDASARAEQRFTGGSSVVGKATYGVAGDMAFGVHAQTTTYSKGAVTVASLLACWSIEGSNAIAKESGTTRATVAVSVGDVLEIHLVITAGAGSLLFKINGVTHHTSAIPSATILGWRPWRFVTTHSGAGSKWSAATLDGEAVELFDPDVAGSYDAGHIPQTATGMTKATTYDTAHRPQTAVGAVYGSVNPVACDCPDPEPEAQAVPARAWLA